MITAANHDTFKEQETPDIPLFQAKVSLTTFKNLTFLT